MIVLDVSLYLVLHCLDELLAIWLLHRLMVVHRVGVRLCDQGNWVLELALQVLFDVVLVVEDFPFDLRRKGDRQTAFEQALGRLRLPVRASKAMVDFALASTVGSVCNSICFPLILNVCARVQTWRHFHGTSLGPIRRLVSVRKFTVGTARCWSRLDVPRWRGNTSLLLLAVGFASQALQKAIKSRWGNHCLLAVGILEACCLLPFDRVLVA